MIIYILEWLFVVTKKNVLFCKIFRMKLRMLFNRQIYEFKSD